jgi:hypothetical protein
MFSSSFILASPFCTFVLYGTLPVCEEQWLKKSRSCRGTGTPFRVKMKYRVFYLKLLLSLCAGFRLY